MKKKFLSVNKIGECVVSMYITYLAIGFLFFMIGEFSMTSIDE